MDRHDFRTARPGHDQMEVKQPRAGFSIRWTSSADEMPAHLWTACFAPSLEGRWWYRALDRSGLESQFTFAYALIERDGNPVGIAPTFLMDVPIDLVAPPLIARLLRRAGRFLPRLRFQRTLFVGSPCSDEGTVGLLPGVSLAEVAPLLQDALRQRARQTGASMIVWKDFPETASTALRSLCASRGLFQVVSYPGTSLPLPDGGFNAYLTTLTSHNRYNLRSRLKRSKAMGDLQVEVLQQPDAPLLDEICGLFWQTYEKATTKFERLTRRFFQLIAEEEVSHFVLLKQPHNGRLAAFMLCFRAGHRVINKFIGLDYRMAGNWFLYFRLWQEAIDWASRSGATEFQSGQTGYRAKLELGHRLIPLTNYCRHKNVLVHHVFALIAKRISWSTLDETLHGHSMTTATSRGPSSLTTAPRSTPSVR